jgi:hypothetical protein
MMLFLYVENRYGIFFNVVALIYVLLPHLQLMILSTSLPNIYLVLKTRFGRFKSNL